MASSTDDTLEGQLINGYIQGAMVFQDTNGDGEHNEGEAFDYTDSEGAFTLEGYVAGGGEVIASTNANTTDVTTGAKVTTEFKLNLDAETDISEGVVISPLSTLLVSGELDEAGLKAKLGIDDSIDIFSYDPIAAAEAAGNLGDTAAAEIALQFVRQHRFQTFWMSVPLPLANQQDSRKIKQCLGSLTHYSEVCNG